MEPWTETLAPPQAGQKLPLPVGAGTPTSGGVEGKGELESGRVTRNLKRRYDEIHHVQKVRGWGLMKKEGVAWQGCV